MNKISGKRRSQRLNILTQTHSWRSSIQHTLCFLLYIELFIFFHSFFFPSFQSNIHTYVLFKVKRCVDFVYTNLGETMRRKNANSVRTMLPHVCQKHVKWKCFFFLLLFSNTKRKRCCTCQKIHLQVEFRNVISHSLHFFRLLDCLFDFKIFQ